MATLMAIGVVAFYGVTFGLTRFTDLNALLVVTLSMVGVAISYIAISLLQSLEG